MRDVSMTGGYLKRFGAGIILSVLLLLMTATGWAAPTVTDVQPPEGSMQPVTATASATFSEAMDPDTITSGSFTVSRSVGIKAIDAGSGYNVALKEDGTVVAWGLNSSYGLTTVPSGLSGVTAIAGSNHIVALKGDGTVVAWGWNGYGQTSVPAGLSRVVAIAAGGHHTVALKGDGTVVAWGWNGKGQTTVPAGLSGVKTIAAGNGHTVVLKNDGTVLAWGWDVFGQSTVPADLSCVDAISAGYYHTVALKCDGTVVAWGDNSEGKTTVPAGLSGVTAISAGMFHTVALKSDGTVVAWGSNSNGGYWAGQSTVPAGLSGVTAIAAGDYHNVVLKDDGTVVAWGDKNYGQCNMPVSLSGVTAVAAGNYNTVVLNGDGKVVAWGLNGAGKSTVPEGLTGVTAIAAGRDHNVALKNNGTVVAWGYNGYGQTTVPAGLSGVIAIAAGSVNTMALKGDGTVVAWGGYNNSPPMPVGLSGVTAIAAGTNYSMALKGDGTVVAWGYNSSVPVGLSGVIAIAAGSQNAMALKGDGTVVAWGINTPGVTTVPLGLSGVVAIAVGNEGHAVALKGDGTVVAWGRNNFGQTTVPAGLSGVTSIAAGNSHTVALKEDGTVVAWGNNVYGQTTVPVSPYESSAAGSVFYDQVDTAIFTPAAPLEPGATYLATVNNGARSVWGDHLATNVRWHFTTTDAIATVTLGDLNQTYDGTPKAVSATTDPAGLTVVTTYNGSTIPPTAVGSYNVVATVSDATFTGKSSGILTITKPTYTVGVSVLGGNGDIWCESPVTEGENSLCTITSAANYHLETFSDNNVDQLAAVSGNAYTISNIMADHAIAGTFAINLRADAGIDQIVPCADPSGAQVILNGSASIGAATFTWSGPFGTISGVSPTVTIPLGTHTLTLTVADNTGRTANDTVVITVFDNSPPLITIMGVANGMTYNLGLVPLATYAASDAQSGLAESTGTLTGTPDAFGCGTFTYTVTATDKAGNSATSSVTYEVKATPAGTSDLIDELVNAGLLPAQTAATLQATLAKALSGYNSNPILGDNMMNTFLNQINAALNSGKINATTAALLNNAANYIMVNN